MEQMKRDRYMRSLAAELRGPHAARERLLVELRDHIDDATADELTQGRPIHDAEQLAIDRLGAAHDITGPWQAYIGRRRRETRRRVALLTIAAATASVLAVAQHASGLRQPTSRCTRTAATNNVVSHNTTPCRNPAKNLSP